MGLKRSLQTLLPAASVGVSYPAIVGSRLPEGMLRDAGASASHKGMLVSIGDEDLIRGFVKYIS